MQSANPKKTFKKLFKTSATRRKYYSNSSAEYLVRFSFPQCEVFVKLFVYVCLNVQKWTHTDTKVTFSPTNPTSTGTFFWRQMKGMNKIRLLRCYGIDFAPIKR